MAGNSISALIGSLVDAASPGAPPSYFTRVHQGIDPEANALAQYYTQNAQKQQMSNQAMQGSLAALADANQQGISNPMQLFGKVAATNPEYLKDYATAAATNPLGFALQQPQSGGQPNPIASLQGGDLLKALPPQIASTIKGYSEGRIPFNARLAATPQGQTMLGLITQYDPTFDTADPTSRSKTRASFTSGADANNVAALNTAMAHAASLKEAYNNLDNGDYPLLNKVENRVSIATGDKKVQEAASDVAAKGHALSGELAKVFRSTGMAEADIKAWEDKLDVNATPSQQKATLNAAMDLMDGRLQALSEKYNQGLGQSKQGIELLSPKARDAYMKVRGEQPDSAGAINVGGKSTGPSKGEISIISPDGIPGTIDASELKDALANGWKQQ